MSDAGYRLNEFGAGELARDHEYSRRAMRCDWPSLRHDQIDSVPVSGSFRCAKLLVTGATMAFVVSFR
ncbi:hypothetical protein EYF80_003812 [Liparis tanakae]|uniref:Uncharacterized protein n=1 Tax=Liparis tanakae TaxID=230148 RepID=A0A4Z2J8D0_9TELE|nr:hypothetical protein EYF80_003812 [Liparis tanakae]